MHKLLKVAAAIIAGCTVHSGFANEICRGKLDIGPAFVHVDILESEKTVKSIDMPAIRGEGHWLIYQGLALKPTLIYASNQSELFGGQLGLGYCIPWNKFLFTPSAGWGYTNFNTRTDVPPYGLTNQKERFRSNSPYIAFDVSYTFIENWRIAFTAQYMWSRTKTKIAQVGTFHSRPEGPNYAAQLEYDVTHEWSVNVGAAYNISLDRERFGIRGYGIKIGIARWFYSGCGG